MVSDSLTKKPKLIVYDFDGVFTDNKVYLNQDGLESVQCNRSDGWYIREIDKLNIKQIVLTSERNPVVEKRCEKLTLNSHCSGEGSKFEKLKSILETESLSLEEVLFVGNAVNDLECLKHSGISVVPSDAETEVLPYADYVLACKGGDGIVRELYNSLLTQESKPQVYQGILESIHVKQKILGSKELMNQIDIFANLLKDCIRNQNTVFFAGNGGSFADSIHLAAEFISKLKTDRKPLPAIALGSNNSNLTAIGNDYSFLNIFSRELEALGKPGDVLVAISTSGNSKNVLNCIQTAEQKGIKIIALTGETGGEMKKLENLFRVPSKNTARIQECHIMVGHLLCEAVEDDILKNQ